MNLRFVTNHSLHSFGWLKLTLFGMRPHVGGLCEALSTVRMGALVRLEASVVVQVRFQMVFLGECLRTDRTGERLDSCERNKIQLLSSAPEYRPVSYNLNEGAGGVSCCYDRQKSCCRWYTGTAFLPCVFSGVVSVAFSGKIVWRIRDTCEA